MQKQSDIIEKGLTFLALFLFTCYALSFGAREHWALDLLRHFIHQYLIGSIILFALTCFYKRWVLTGIMLLVSASTFIEISARLNVATQIQSNSEYDFKVAHYNRRYTIDDHEELKNWLKSENPDFFIIQEARETHAQALEDLRTIYPYQIKEPRKNAFGMIFVSKFPIKIQQVIPTQRYALDNFYIHAVIELLDQTAISVYTIHPPPPTSALLQTQRNQDLKAVIQAIQKDTTDNIILMGDWNITPYSPYFSDLLNETELKNQYTSYFPFPTWPSPFVFQLFQIPIDHILFKGNLHLTDRKRGPPIESDHYPVVAEFTIIDERI